MISDRRSALLPVPLTLLVLVSVAHARNEVSPPSDPYYRGWMGDLFPFIQNLTILDLALPGTHDTMTFDLSTTVADNANDLPLVVADLLHQFHDELQWLDIGSFMRNQSKTQGLNITSQLDAGSRFIDFRTIYTAPPNATNNDTHEWYCLHFMQSLTMSLVWLERIHEWIVANPSEMIVLWISKHGNNCGTMYTGIPVDALQLYWSQIRSMFGPLLFNHTAAPKPLNETTLAELMASGQRVVVYASDYTNFTGPDAASASVAYNDCLLDNEGIASADNSSKSVAHARSAFLDAREHMRNNTKPRNMFYLLSMATDPVNRIFEATMVRYFWLLTNQTNTTDTCSTEYHIPGMDSWCPMHLQSSCQLANYYNQISLGEVALCTTPNGTSLRGEVGGRDEFACPLGLPNAIYIDALDVNGTIRVGTTIYGPGYPDGWSDTGEDGYGLAGYGYVDTFALVNLRRGCEGAVGAEAAACRAKEATLLQRWRTHPVTRWNNPSKGRLVDWPLP